MESRLRETKLKVGVMKRVRESIKENYIIVLLLTGLDS